jgi:RecA/RadA recombinase
MLYKRVTNGLDHKGNLIPLNTVKYYVPVDRDMYVSIYNYNEEQKKRFDETGSVSGIRDVTTNKLIFDFDDAENIEKARQDALTLCERLVNFGILPNSILIAFSGNKGFSVELNTNENFNVTEFKNLTHTLASGLDTFDKVVCDANRVIRLYGTKHPTSGLYKMPISLQTLENNDAEVIKAAANDRSNGEELDYTKQIALPQNILSLRHVVTKATKPVVVNEEEFQGIDFNNKVKGWSNCKFAMLDGYGIKPHDRHTKLLAIVATSKALNELEGNAYYRAKHAMKRGVERYGGEECSKDDLQNIVKSVYSKNWTGGTFSCRDGKSPWLTDLCNSLGRNKCNHKETTNELVTVDKVFSTFKNYAENADKNMIKTGIPSLDNSIKFRVGQMVGLLGAPSSGKTSLALNLLENTSKQGLCSVFYSLDMADSEMYQKISQKVTGWSEDQIYDVFKTQNKEKINHLMQKTQEAFGNVKFSFNTGISVESITEAITEHEAMTNEKVKLLLIDYNELLSGPYSDATANSGHIAGELKKLTNQLGVCTIVLLQPAKVWGDASDELNSYRATKGSSLLEQCFSIILGIYRPGFSAENNSADDKYMIMNTLKNRMGKLYRLEYCWDGPRGQITDIDDIAKDALYELLERKREEKAANSSNRGLG